MMSLSRSSALTLERIGILQDGKFIIAYFLEKSY